MATIDPLAFQRGFQGTQAIFDTVRQNKLANLALQEKERDAERSNALASIVGNAANYDEGGNLRRDVLPQIAQADPASYGTYRKAIADQDKAQAEAQKAKREELLSWISFAEPRMANVNSPETWAAFKASAAQVFPDYASRLPDQYDPIAIQQARANAVPIVEQLKLAQQDKQFNYRQQNDQANRDVTLRGQDMSAATARRGQDMTDTRAREKNNGKPLPTAALKMQQEAIDAIGTVGSINADLKAIDQQIQSGKLDFGPVSNIVNQARNAVGISSEESRNFSSFKSTLEKLRNDSLRLNKGVQTEGDAQRAWNELFSNINDKKLVQQRLAEIQAINDRAANLRRLEVDTIRRNYGADPLETEQFASQPPAIGRGQGPQRSVVRTGTYNGRKVVQYSDGTVEYQ